MDKIVIAYEPVWAIGTGLTASPDQAQEMHKYIRDLVKEKYGNDCAKKLPILYGGSCKPSNAAEIFSKPDVDGGLIGGAALKKEDFTAIVEAGRIIYSQFYYFRVENFLFLFRSKKPQAKRDNHV